MNFVNFFICRDTTTNQVHIVIQEILLITNVTRTDANTTLFKLATQSK